MRRIFKIANSEEVEIKFSELEKEDVFKMYDDGKLVVNAKGRSVFIAAGKPFVGTDGKDKINIY